MKFSFASKMISQVHTAPLRASMVTHVFITSFALIFGFLTTMAQADSQTTPAAVLWNAKFTAEMKLDTLAPALIARNLAILHSALWNSWSRGDGRSEKLSHVISYKICSHLLPGHSAAFERILNEVYPEQIREDDRTKADGFVDDTLHHFADDGASRHVTYTAKNTPGAWFRTPPFFRTAELPHWGTVRPIQIAHSADFRPKGPPALSSREYADAWSEIYKLGGKNSALRTSEQSRIASFWSDFSYTETPVGHWNNIARGIATAKQLGERETAELFYLLNVTLCDTAIACWDTKYAYNFWRPITAIQRADIDDNPATEADPVWEPFLKTPNHPEYVSGHSAFSGAASQILIDFSGTDNLTFEISSDTLPNITRRFSSLRACAKECGESRIYGGIHFRFSCEDGYTLGRQVAETVWAMLKEVR
ncbi:MAG: vanadium-dependent haloperoxidase [Verrucomicrobiota bacterium]